MRFCISRTRAWKLGSLSAMLMIFARSGAAADVKLAWDASPDTDVVAYRVYYGTTAGVFGSMMQVAAPATTAVVGSLMSGATYYFAAKAVDAAGFESDSSNLINVSTIATETNPAPTYNAPPTLNAPPGMIISQNVGPQTVPLSGITSGSTSEVQPLTVTANSSNGQVIPTPTVTYSSPNSVGTLVFKPATNAIGWSTLSVAVNDGGLTTTQSFWVLVNNQPTLNPIANVLMNEDGGTQTVPLSGITSGAPNESQPLTVTAASSNPGLIPNPRVTYTSPNSTGILTFAPSANAVGRAEIVVMVSDGQYGNNYVQQRFTVTVNPVNDAPTLGAIANMTIDSRGGAKAVTLTGISAGANESQSVVVTATSSNPSIVATPTVAYVSPSSTGTLTLMPALNQSGTATITVTVNDGQLANNITTRTFTVTLSSLPKISGLTVQTLDARTMRVAWNTDRSAIGSLAYGLTPTVSQVSGSTSGTSHSITLTNLTPGTFYYLQPRAWTSAGTATAITTATTEARQVLEWDSDTGTLSGPFKVGFTLDFARGLNYRMWARVKTSAGGGTFRASIDGAGERALFVSDTNAANIWHWAPVMDDANRTNAVTLPFEAGYHTFTLAGGSTVWWDQFLWSNDPLWQPILPTTRPKLSAVRDSAQSATLTWSDPSGNATSVGVEYSTDGVNFQALTTVAASQTKTTVGNLSPQTYYFRVFSYNTLDRTAYSNVAAALY